MKSLTVRTVVSAASSAGASAHSGRKRKTLPRSKFTRNTLRRQIQERELQAEVEEALDELHNLDQDYFEEDFGDGFDQGGWDPYIEERWDYWRYGSGGYGYYGCDDECDSSYSCDDDPYYDHYYDYSDPCYYDGPAYDYDFGYSWSRRRSYRFADSWPPESGPSVDHVSLADVLITKLLARSSDMEDERGVDEVPQDYFEEPDLPAPVYDRLRFASERFVRRPGRKVRFKKDKEQRGGNRRGRCDYTSSIEKFIGGRWERRGFQPDGSRKVKSLNRHVHVERDCTVRGLLERQQRIDLNELLTEYFEDCGIITQNLVAPKSKGRQRNRGSEVRKPERNGTRADNQVKLVSPARKRLSPAEIEALNAQIRASLQLSQKV